MEMVVLVVAAAVHQDDDHQFLYPDFPYHPSSDATILLPLLPIPLTLDWPPSVWIRTIV